MKKLSDKQSVKEVIAQMTVEEKAKALTGESMFSGMGMEKYGIPAVRFLDGGTGINYFQLYLECFVRNHDMSVDGGAGLFDITSEAQVVPMLLELDENEEAAKKAEEKLQKEVAFMKEKMKAYIPDGVLPGCFPPGILFGATWDRENIYEAGKALGKECGFYGIDVLLGSPNVNIHRDPLGGRVFEGYSEDPCLTAKLAPSFVKGVQSEGVIANVKHFAANNQETDRRTVNEMIPERALYEIYFPGFKACVQEGGCKTVMSSYNAINGTYSAMNGWLLTEVLRDEWGFEGFVVSDWGGAYDQPKAYEAGNDYDMPGPRSVDTVVQAVENGELDEAVLDRALTRYLNLVLEMPIVVGRKNTEMDYDYSQKAAYNAAKEGIVLLKNENGTLPLNKEEKVCFIGEKSKRFIESGGGSANVRTDRSTSMVSCAEQIAGAGNVSFGKIEDGADAVVVTVGVIGQEGFDRADMELEAKDKKLLEETLAQAKAAGKKTIVILNVCGPVDMNSFIDNADAVLCVFIPGMEGGRVTADILYGNINPSGKLPITFPQKYEDGPTYGNFPGRDQEVWYGEGIFVGYRYYDQRDVAPLFPFGHGLSYTQFEIGNIKTNTDKIEANDASGVVEVSVTVKNTGKMAGKEVVQLYVAHKDPTLPKPPKELKDFQKVCLEPGEAKIITFAITNKELQSYDSGMKKWITEPGVYELQIGNSSRGIKAVAEIEATGYNPYGVNEKTTLGQLVIIPGALEKLMEFCPDTGITKESIELSILFASTGELGDYWKRIIEPLLDGMNAQQKEDRYKEMLKVMNQFH
ncbi:glycoside hydrolase family 3 C-terminal domain-containing protein [Christensenellaceae bacterium OttesenSCG-928-K19]|nr:glycoside hydrolase family 3 C-terminal domain-containing protein [Christensenellaceae bacterium OttesenSCG-928-K19]